MRDPIGPQIERLFEDRAPPVSMDELDPAVVLDAPPAIGKRLAVVAGLGLLATLVVIGVVNFGSGEDPVVTPDQTDWDVVEFPPGMAFANEVAVWTGEEVVFWGGQDDTVDSAPTGDPGFAYNPDTKQWRTLPPSGKKPTIGAAGVWTGEEVIICCGGGEQFADFAQTVAYNPSTDSWRSLADAPISGTYSDAVWTGAEMLVVASDGVAAYDPGTDSWSTFPEPPDEVTVERVYQIPWRVSQIIWTGDELIGWSREVERVTHRGFALNPTTGEWRLLPEPPAWPAAADIVWTGEKLIIWGGLPAHYVGSERAVGSVYDPETDSWVAMSEALPEPEGYEGNLGSQSMIWMGDVALISTGAFGTGVDPVNPLLLAYDPDTDTWEHISETVLPLTAWQQDIIIAGDRVLFRADKLYISPPGWIPRGEPVTADSWSVTTTSTTTTTTIEGRVGLYPMDPLSLEPLGSLPITTGDWLRGSASPNAEWLALSVWIATAPDTDLIRIVNVPDGKEVAEAKVLVPTNPIISDSGTAYWTQGSIAPILRLYRLTPGDDSSELAFDDFPDGFETWMEPTILDSDRLGWLGRFALPTGENAPGLVVLDLASATTTSFLLSDVRLGGDEVVVDDTTLSESYEPEVAWDSERNVAYVVHADQDVFTSVDLNTGETSTRTWAQETSWLGRLFAWLIPPAQAKGMSLGTRRSVALSADGSTLFVGTVASRIENAEGSDLSVLWQPEGVVALDTETGAVLNSWSIPASDVYLAPSGDHLVAVGLTVRESLLDGSTTGEGAFIIDVRSGEVIGHLPETDDNGGVVQFSADGEIAYLTDYEGKVEVIDLATGDLITESFGPQELTVFGRAGLIATRR